MAKIDMVMPKMGESIMEGTILKWHKAVGDAVEKDENILDIATDKVDAEVPATESGILAEILFEEGADVPVGDVIARIETDKNADIGSQKPTPETPVKTDKADEEAPPQKAPSSEPATETVAQSEPSQEKPASGRFYSPVVMAIAQQEGIPMSELDAIKGSGINQRVTKKDIQGYLKTRSGAAPAAAPAAPASAPASAASSTPAASSPGSHQPPVVYDPERSEVIVMDNMRRLIAEHMVRSKQTSAHVTSVSEADVTGLVKLVKSRKKAFQDANGIKLTFTPFMVDACIKTLKQYPMVNASVNGNEIILKKYINFGIAVALGEDGAGGLIVPVIKNADEMNLVGLSRSIGDLAQRAREKKLQPDEIQGGTFTLTNYGTSGNLFGAPIINQPQVAILGTGAIVKRPMVHTLDDGTDSIVIRSMMYCSLSYDHRIIDGSLAGAFLQQLVKNLESYNEQTIL